MGLETLVFENGITSLVLLETYFPYQVIKFSYIESFPKISSIYCDECFLS